MTTPILSRHCLLHLGSLLFLAGSLAAQSQTIRPDPLRDETVSLPEFRVETNKDNSYLATETTSGTRMAAKILDLPFSVQSLPSEFFNDFMLFDFDELNGYVSNVKPADPAGAGNGGSRLRGFGMPQFRNGFGIIQQPDSNNVDRVEVLKGPAAGTYGATAPGGIINFITKKPQTRPAYTLDYIVGSDDYQRVNGSATGPLAKNLFYRVDGTYYDFERPTDWWYNRTLDISTGLTWKLTPATSLSGEFAFTERKANPYPVFTRWVDRSGRTQGLVYTIPEDQYPGFAERLSQFNQAGPYNRYERYNKSYYLTFQHRFSPVWSLQANLAYTDRRFRRVGTTGLGNWSFVTNNWTASRLPYHQRYKYDQWGAQADLSGKFGTREIQQQSHVGLDWYFIGQNFKTWQLSNTAQVLAGLAPGTTLALWQRPNPFDPDYLLRAGTVDFNEAWPMVDGSTSNLYTENLGAFYNHMVTLLDERLAAMVTVRADQYEIKRQQPLSANAKLREADSGNNYATYSTGLSYKILGQKLVAYGSYGTSFDPNPQVDANTGEVYGNTEAKGGEFGFKGILFGGGFSYSAAVFRATQDNEATANPANPTGSDPLLPRLAPGGSTRSQGIGIDVSGRLTPNLSMIGNMGWLDCRTVQNLAAPTSVGQRVSNSGPARKGSVAATYAFPQARLKGLRAGLTYYYSTENIRIYGTATSTSVYLPANSYWGGMMAYAFKVRGRTQVTLHLAVTDLFSQQVLTDNAFAPAGAQWKLSTGVKF
ncbi:MAG: TonB-dependent receptor [Verrucomicrobia bacterium]|nr:TonB-dependent receptor [Verrucomicrobiota bacterium]